MKTTVVKARNALEQAYLDHLRLEGLSEDTIRQRIYVLRHLPDPTTATVEDVRAALSSNLSASTRATYLRVLRVVFGDLVRLGLVGADPMQTVKIPKTPRRQPRPIPRSVVDRLLEQPSEDGRGLTILGAFAGLRAGEAGRVSGADLIDTDDGPALRIHGKGNVVATVPAHPRVVELLAPHKGDPEPLFPWWPKSINRAWKRAAAEVGVTGYTFHALRHSFATELYRRTGGDLLTVAALCRHASVATTQGYAAVAQSAPYRAVAGL